MERKEIKINMDNIDNKELHKIMMSRMNSMFRPDRGKQRIEAHALALRMLSDLLSQTDMRLGQIMHSITFEDGKSRDIFHVTDEEMAHQLMRLRVAMVGEVKDE